MIRCMTLDWEELKSSIFYKNCRQNRHKPDNSMCVCCLDCPIREVIEEMEKKNERFIT